MLFALIALGLVAVAGIADLAVEAVEQGSDEIEERLDELRNDPRVEELLGAVDGFDSGSFGGATPQQIAGQAGLDETLLGRDGDDTISGNRGDMDTLEGGIGNDQLTIRNSNTGSGGPGADSFILTPDSDGVITDFRPGVDSLRLNVTEDLLYQERGPALAWRATENGIELHYASEGEISFTHETFVVVLEGLSVPPPVEDITFTVTDDRQEAVFEFTGDQINFAQNLIGTDGDDEFVLTDAYSDYEVRTREGDDDVIFDSYRGRTYLGDGDDTYRSVEQAVVEDPNLDGAETVLGGAGDDFIQGSTSDFAAYGGLGDDTLSAVRTDRLSITPMVLNGGDGDDDITFGEMASVTGGQGADAFTFLPTFGQAGTPATLTDFDPDQDALVIQLDRFYDGPGIATLSPELEGEGTYVRIDGQTALLLSRSVTDLSAIVVVQ